MNERIRELADQAGYSWHNSFAGPILTQRGIEKFAELIVRECADVAWMNTPETEELEYSHLISNKILEHFEIK